MLHVVLPTDIIYIKISPDHNWTVLHCQNDRKYASDRTYRNKLEG